ncbi:hypothetical protein ACL6C3_15390 [Capilliphycus salinus ALCB114379]|uniref:hypothetical protein n=1 Tax=Capilliphycus salinus TaxID=2768948 RepID=UPI0039A61D31
MGTENRDVIRGLSGHDVLMGLESEDNIFGYSGDDLMMGNQGEDFIEGNGGDDTFRFTLLGKRLSCSTSFCGNMGNHQTNILWVRVVLRE